MNRRPTAPTVALATGAEWPDLDEDSAPLVPALRERGIDVSIPVWSDPGVDWGAFDAVVVRSTWDYFDRQDEFVAWARRVGSVTRLANPAEVLVWNSHKSYLRDLAAAGVPVVDTIWAARGEQLDLAAALDERGWHDAVFKPAVGGGSEGLVRVHARDGIADAQQLLDAQLRGGDVLIQPLLPSIQEEGELSLFFAGGEHTHTVRKVPKGGDIRSQPEFGGSSECVDAAADALDVAGRAIAGAPGELLYARVDLVRAPDATLRLIELEVIEPRLFLTLAPQATPRFADAIRAIV